MVDIDTHRIIDMIESREIEDVTQWLKTYPNLTIVSRDGSVSYNSAIKGANENIVQISDRFHLIKGLTDAAKKHITSIMNANVGIPVEGSHYDGNQTEIYWIRSTKEDFPTKRHNENYEKKVKTVERVRELSQQGKTRVQISEEVGISYATVKRYQSPNFNPVNGGYNTVRASKIKPYAKEIKRLLSEGRTFKEIEEVIKKSGYTGSSSSIRMYSTRERKLLKEAQKSVNGPIEKIERKWLIKLLYKPLDKIKELTQYALDQVIEKYPIIQSLYDIVGSFKQTLFAKKPEEIDKWLDEAEGLGIEGIQSFVNGIRRDLPAVKKAIELDYNNGLAEGSVNKLKVIKRIMYGRNSFRLLKAKVLRLELKRKTN
jgi:transposase